MMMMME